MASLPNGTYYHNRHPMNINTEYEVKEHLYQILDKQPAGPRGAFEARKANGGLYVRVDMPGVPPDGVKLVKRPGAGAVSFTGKAPKQWPKYDSAERVYAGYVVLDRNPDEVDVEMTVSNGSLRLFFYNANGVLHPITSRTRNLADLFDEYPGLGVYSGQQNAPVFPNYKHWHINPFLVDGVEGVYENKDIDDGSKLKYLRVDMPGIKKENHSVKIDGAYLIHGGKGTQEHPLDEGGRTYSGALSWMCPCCKMSDVVHEMDNGVLRILFRGARDPSRKIPGRPCSIALLQGPLNS